MNIGPGVTIIKVEVTSGDGEALNVYTVTVTYEDLLDRYDYFNGVIGRDEVIEVIRLYFSS